MTEHEEEESVRAALHDDAQILDPIQKKLHSRNFSPLQCVYIVRLWIIQP